MRKSEIETLLIEVVARAAPWLAPLPTAYLVGRATIQYLDWPVWVAIIAALDIESLGLASAATALMLRDYNKSKRKSDPDAPAQVAFLLLLVYVVITIGLSVILDVFPILALYAPAIFPLLSLTGTLNLALRNDHRRRLEAIAAEKAERKQKRSEMNGERSEVNGERLEKNAKRSGVNGNRSREQAVNALLNILEASPDLSYSQAGQAIGRSKTWVAEVVRELQKSGHLVRDGKRLIVNYDGRY